ncbi:MAG: RHS repeat-associated core domain-containing protein [Bacteroidota bacterium]
MPGFDDFGNMTFRKDNERQFEERFDYDGMNRLTSVEYWVNNVHHSGSDLVMTYHQDGLGNLEAKSDVAGNLVYGENGAGPNVLTSMKDSYGYMPPEQQIGYTPFNKVKQITELQGEDNYTLSVDYRVDNQRSFTELAVNNVPVKTKRFFDEYQEVTTDNQTTAYYFIYAPTGLCAIKEKELSQYGDETLWLVHNDHLGSPVLFIDATNPTNRFEQSFSVWGIPRDPSDWSETAENPLYADIGFTGHEDLAEFKLINMSGRVYDPVLGRFLSPDPYIQVPEFPWGFNRYSYCLNNPLVYTDPDGDCFLLAAAAIYILYFTDFGYDVQKYLFPVAFHVDVELGNARQKIGIEASFGLPQALPLSYRVNGGVAYYWNDYDHSYTGWEKSYGDEWAVGIPGSVYFRHESMVYDKEGTNFDQTRYTITFGNPLVNMQNENDARIQELDFIPSIVPKAMSDMYLSEEARINIGPIQIGTTIFTGRVKKDKYGRDMFTPDGPNGTWIEEKEYRAGIIYLKLGPLKFGIDSEGIRDWIQNGYHDRINNKRFRKTDKKARFIWQLG